MLVRGAAVINASGSIGGVYYQRDKTGLHIKAQPRKIKRIDAASQTTAKIFLTCVNAWRNFNFTQTQIELWNQYARRHPRFNGVGDAYILTAQLIFYRHNFIRIRNSLPIIYEPPAD